MYRNLLIIFALAVSLTLLLVWRPWRIEHELPPSLYDRLPEAEVIGVSNVLELSSSLSKTLFYYKIPFRDLISPEFILSQGKNYGLDVQSPVYFFMNEEEYLPKDWGIMATVRDSSKVGLGVESLKKFMSIKTLVVHDVTIYTAPEHNAYFVYGDNWFLLYQGKEFMPILEDVLLAKRNEISPHWRTFINDNAHSKEDLIATIRSDKFNEYGVESARVTLKNDSSSLIFNTAVTHKDSLSFQARFSGPAFSSQEFTKRLVNLHVDIDKLRTNTNDPVYKLLNKLGEKVSFPFDAFMNAWEGDVAFRQGGIEIIKERYIESELDENFNITEVTKYRNVKVSGFALYLSMNGRVHDLISQLRKKGILTQDSNKFRLLFSPPLRMHSSDSSLLFHTSTYRPEIYQESNNSVRWTFNYTPVQFFIDSTSTKTVFGKIQVPLKKIIKDNLPALE